MKIFDYKDFVLSINKVELLLVPEFKAVFTWDKTKDKSKAFRVFTYIYLMLDWSSIYIDYTEENRKVRSIDSSGLTEKEIELDVVKNAFNKYYEIINSNRILRYAKAQWQLLDKIEIYVDSVDFTEVIESGPQKGRLVHSVKEARDTIKQMPELIDKAKEVRKQVQDELKESTGARGNQEQPLEQY